MYEPSDVSAEASGTAALASPAVTSGTPVKNTEHATSSSGEVGTSVPLAAKEKITEDLEMAILNYGRGQKIFELPILKETEWEEALSNISFITYLQRIPIGTKKYNNHYIVSSKTNSLFVNPDNFYFSGEDEYFHRYNCNKCKDTEYTGYMSMEYTLRETKTDYGSIYHYLHDSPNTVTETETIENYYSEKSCYYCVVNRSNFEETTDVNIQNKMQKAYYKALARERYVR